MPVPVRLGAFWIVTNGAACRMSPTGPIDLAQYCNHGWRLERPFPVAVFAAKRNSNGHCS
jgi:hypothetical protein